MAYYLKTLISLALFASVVGLAGPALASAKSTEAVLLAVAIVALLPVALFYLWRKELRRFVDSAKKDIKP